MEQQVIVTWGFVNPGVVTCHFCGEAIPPDQAYVSMPGRWSSTLALAHTTCYVEQMMFDQYARITEGAASA